MKKQWLVEKYVDRYILLYSTSALKTIKFVKTKSKRFDRTYPKYRRC